MTTTEKYLKGQREGLIKRIKWDKESIQEKEDKIRLIDKCLEELK